MASASLYLNFEMQRVGTIIMDDGLLAFHVVNSLPLLINDVRLTVKKVYKSFETNLTLKEWEKVFDHHSVEPT